MDYHLVFAAALDFVKSHTQDPISQKAFDEACGVGIVITPEQIEDAVSAGSPTDSRFSLFKHYCV